MNQRLKCNISILLLFFLITKSTFGQSAEQQMLQLQQTPQWQKQYNFSVNHIPLDGFIFREVDDQIYNVSKNQLWNIHGGTIQSVGNGIVLMDIYKFKYVNPTWYNYGYSEYLPGEDDEDKIKEFDRTVAITNLPDFNDATIDKQITILAMKVGVLKVAGNPLEFYDCGTPYFPPQPSQEEIDAAKLREKQKIFLLQSNAIIWLQPQAINGDAGAQYDLAEHYLKGEGCETNRELAIYWLKQSAIKGNIEASNKLTVLTP